MRLTEHVYLVGGGRIGFGISDALDCHVYAVDGGDELALVDAGGGRAPERLLANLAADGLPTDRLRTLLPTHGLADHAGGATRFQKEYGMQVCASADMATAIEDGDEEAISLRAARERGLYRQDFRVSPARVGRRLQDGDTVTVGQRSLTVIGTPRHSRGHPAYAMEAHGVHYLFTGDALFFGGRLALQDIPDCDLRESLRSIEKLAGLAVDASLPGHLAISLSEGRRHIDAALDAMRALRVPENISGGGAW